MKTYLQTSLFCFGLMFLPIDSKAKSGFEIYGDVMQILPIAMMGYSWYLGDYQGIKEQAIGAGASFLGTHAIKYTFVLISRSSPSTARISQRPNNGSFDGFPSGHTSWAFSAVGFSLKRYGWKLALPTGIIATSVGISRVYAERHTTTQVIAGAILGFAASWLIASKYQKPNQNISFYTNNAPDGTPSYHFSYIRRF